SKQVFPELRVGLVHGRLKSREQDSVMDKFRKGELDILVSTTVLEVGIDVANASVMVIENAERFGLSQLHQLRGRIGRGPYDSQCILVAHPQTEEARLRIKAIVENCDGFRIAEEDLKIRGPGEFFGKRQSGLTELKIANPLTQMHLLKKAREEALKLIDKDPKMEEHQDLPLKDKLLQRFPGYEKLIIVG
ncbi:MAG: helicase-related protein, partial [Candidatus Omnitrophota bacterium]